MQQGKTITLQIFYEFIYGMQIFEHQRFKYFKINEKPVESLNVITNVAMAGKRQIFNIVLLHCWIFANFTQKRANDVRSYA